MCSNVLIVSDKSNEGFADKPAAVIGVEAEALAPPETLPAAAAALAAALADKGLAGGATGAGAVLGASSLTALLEITKRRRTGAGLALEILALLGLGRGASLGTVTLRFNINYETEKYRAGSEIITARSKNRRLLTMDSRSRLQNWELRTPED